MIPALVAGSILISAGAASAAQVYDLDISYIGGASFTGTVTLSTNTATDTVSGVFDYFTGLGRNKTAHSETINTITTTGPVLGAYNSTLTGPVAGQSPKFSYKFVSGVPTPTRPVVELVDGVSSISFTAVAGVPEPGEWALLILGIFGMGALLRARRAGALAVVRA